MLHYVHQRGTNFVLLLFNSGQVEYSEWGFCWKPWPEVDESDNGTKPKETKKSEEMSLYNHNGPILWLTIVFMEKYKYID